MNQRKLLAILYEASEQQCTSTRRAEILEKLHTEVSRTNASEEMQTLLSYLFVQTTQNHPEHLTALFPFFATLCGDRSSDELFSSIDWSIVE